MEKSFYIKENDFGKGLFAKSEINKFERILIFEGPIVSGEESMLLDLKHHNFAIGNALQIGKDKYIYVKDPGRIVNHSCSPNSGIIEDNILISIKKINLNEEITWDYSTTMDEDSWILKCRCGNENCRKIIKDFKYLPREIQERYLKLGIVQRFISENFPKQIY